MTFIENEHLSNLEAGTHKALAVGYVHELAILMLMAEHADPSKLLSLWDEKLQLVTERTLETSPTGNLSMFQIALHEKLGHFRLHLEGLALRQRGLSGTGR
jgi:hypothetical protein